MTERDLRILLGSKIKQYRSDRSISQAELAERLDLSVNFLSNIENGIKWISPQTLVKIASVLKIEPYELFMPPHTQPDSVTAALTRYTDEAIAAVARTLKEVQGYYLAHSDTQAEKAIGSPSSESNSSKVDT